jgi:hypothetical protein
MIGKVRIQYFEKVYWLKKNTKTKERMGKKEISSLI